MVTLGTRLRALREEKELTLEQVANSVGTTKVSINLNHKLLMLLVKIRPIKIDKKVIVK